MSWATLFELRHMSRVPDVANSQGAALPAGATQLRGNSTQA